MANFNSRSNNLEYSLEFHTQPLQTVKPVTSVSKENISILNEEISKLLVQRAIRPVNFTNAAFYSRLFLVPAPSDRSLSALNQFVINEHFQMENISCLKQILNQHDFMVKLGLKDAYLTVGVHARAISTSNWMFVKLNKSYLPNSLMHIFIK